MENGKRGQARIRPSHGNVDSEEREGGIASEQERVIDESVRRLYGLDIAGGQSILGDEDQNGCIFPCRLNVSSHGAQSFTPDLAKFRCRQTATQVFVFRRIDEIAESLNIDGLNPR